MTRQAPRRGGPSAAYRDSIDENSLLTMPGDEDDETADGETIWFARATGPAEQNEHTFDCGPSRLIKNHYSVPVEWLNLDELTDEHAIFSVWPTEQDRIATSHLLPMHRREVDRSVLCVHVFCFGFSVDFSFKCWKTNRERCGTYSSTLSQNYELRL